MADNGHRNDKEICHVLKNVASMCNIISSRVHSNTGRLQAWLIAYRIAVLGISSITSVNRKINLSTTWLCLSDTQEAPFVSTKRVFNSLCTSRFQIFMKFVLKDVLLLNRAGTFDRVTLINGHRHGIQTATFYHLKTVLKDQSEYCFVLSFIKQKCRHIGLQFISAVLYDYKTSQEALGRCDDVLLINYS